MVFKKIRQLNFNYFDNYLLINFDVTGMPSDEDDARPYVIMEAPKVVDFNQHCILISKESDSIKCHNVNYIDLTTFYPNGNCIIIKDYRTNKIKNTKDRI